LEARLDFDGVHVLDLYAGSGALGLEAVSRGAAGALLIESDARAARVISANIAATGLSSVRVRRSTVAAALAGPVPRAFGLVFADPPYAAADSEIASVLGSLTRGWLSEGALTVLERSARSPETDWPAG